jgi:hypothetical protein
MTHRATFTFLSLLITVFASVSEAPAQSTFQITQLFSNIDGSLQFVELTETAGLNGQHRFTGLTLTITHGGIEKKYTFPRDLPNDRTAHMTIVVAASQLPVGEPYGAVYYCCWNPTFSSLPPRFLPTGGATLDFAGTDRMTYAALPTDGISALSRDGTVQRATVPMYASCVPDFPGVGCAARERIAQSYVFAIEYYHAIRDHYFVTALADEIDVLDRGQLVGWKRTGESFLIGAALNTYPGLNRPVCRFYIPPAVGDSHFFSASTDECEAVRTRFPQFTLETTAAFHAALPDPSTGVCPQDLDFENGGGLLTPLYRLWNRRIDSNHRYTTSIAIRDAMISEGYVSEGYGPIGVAMCVP